MSTTGQQLVNDINRYVRNYAPEAFHDMRLNSILLRLTAFIDSLSGGTTSSAMAVAVTSANFTDATHCPLVALNGQNISVFWGDVGRVLIPTTEWTPMVGGGFQVLVAGFDATANSYSFLVFPIA